MEEEASPVADLVAEEEAAGKRSLSYIVSAFLFIHSYAKKKSGIKEILVYTRISFIKRNRINLIMQYNLCA